VQAVKKVKTSQEKARLAAKLAADKKGEDIVLLDMQGISDVCDWFVLVSADSTRRMKAISRSIGDGMRESSFSPLHVDRKQSLYWILLDYADVVVHIFYKDIREFYGLERLWSNAPREYIDT
jgi:ribosome-associated protein